MRLFVPVPVPVPHAGSTQIPQGSGSCLSSLTFVISGKTASLERKQAEDLIKRYGGRVTQEVGLASVCMAEYASTLPRWFACGAGLVKDDAPTAGHRRLRYVPHSHCRRTHRA